MKKIKVNVGTPYEVCVGNGLLDFAGKEILKLTNACRVMLVSDDKVFALYGEKVKASLIQSGFEVECFVFENGESSKNTKTLISLLEYMAEKQITRRDIAIALGGGVVGDVTGFAAAVYQRGIRYVQIPTTLLAMVDSSVGGKTAVDLEAGKNLAGAFWQPMLVICDVNALDTLSDAVFADGCAEVIKYGIIADEALFGTLEKSLDRNSEKLSDVICRCIEIKADVVEKDEREGGLRQILNFGHTAAHGIEKLTNYEVSHGSAVAIGMLIAAKASEKRGFCKIGTADRIKALLDRCGLPSCTDLSASSLAEVALSDKKREGDGITFVFTDGIGSCRRIKLPTSELTDLFEEGM